MGHADAFPVVRIGLRVRGGVVVNKRGPFRVGGRLTTRLLPLLLLAIGIR